MGKKSKSNKYKKHKSNHEENKKSFFGSFYKTLKKKEKTEDKERESYLNMLSSTLNLPSDILTGAPIITLIGTNEISVENYKRIIEYTKNNIKILTNVGIVSFGGKNLKILYFGNDEIKISGRFNQIQYGNIND